MSALNFPGKPQAQGEQVSAENTEWIHREYLWHVRDGIADCDQSFSRRYIRSAWMIIFQWPRATAPSWSQALRLPVLQVQVQVPALWGLPIKDKGMWSIWMEVLTARSYEWGTMNRLDPKLWRVSDHDPVVKRRRNQRTYCQVFLSHLFSLPPSQAYTGTGVCWSTDTAKLTHLGGFGKRNKII